MKKTFKNFSLFLVAIMALFVGFKTVDAATRPQTPQTFTFDFTFKFRLGDLVDNKDGTYSVPMTAYKTTDYTDTLTLEGDEIHYKVTEISEKDYNTLKAYQDEMDKQEKTKDIVDDYYYTDDETLKDNINLPQYILDYMEAIKNGEDVDKNPWWCYDDPKTGAIVLTADCETKYYIVTVDGYDMETTDALDVNWNYHTARVYKVDANPNQDKCEPITIPDEPKEETTPNPKTGIATPYVICGAIALVGVVVFVSNKKKKYM